MFTYPDATPYPLALLVRCCDVHVDCESAPASAVHRFLDPVVRRANHEAAVAHLQDRHERGSGKDANRANTNR